MSRPEVPAELPPLSVHGLSLNYSTPSGHGFT